MQWLIATFSNQFHQFLVIQSIKHPFIQFSRHTVECRLIPVKNGDRVTISGTDCSHRIFFQFDRLIRSIYTLKYLRDPQMERNIRRSQNRIESYHQLRAAVTKVGGKKELTGKNDIETEISNQCGRLISNAIVYYNSAILSRLLKRLETEGNEKAIEALTRISPVAWQHILLNGHYTFQNSNELIDLDTLVAGLKLG